MYAPGYPKPPDALLCALDSLLLEDPVPELKLAELALLPAPVPVPPFPKLLDWALDSDFEPTKKCVTQIFISKKIILAKLLKNIDKKIFGIRSYIFRSSIYEIIE